jgi:preprotein translocase subunit SecF
MDDFFGKKYKKYMVLPIILLIPMLFLIFIFPGISPGIDLTGGNVIIIRSEIELNKVQIEDAINSELGYSLPFFSAASKDQNSPNSSTTAIKMYRYSFMSHLLLI